ncbi:hypothetical protein GCM10009551_013660 [Nocardiopsis tropica]
MLTEAAAPIEPRDHSYSVCRGSTRSPGIAAKAAAATMVAPATSAISQARWTRAGARPALEAVFRVLLEGLVEVMCPDSDAGPHADSGPKANM